VPANGALSIRHTTRNFESREGAKPGAGQIAGVALMDSRSIAATAARGGVLTAATDIDYDDTIPAFDYDERIYAGRVYNGWDKPEGTPLEYGPNIKKLYGDEFEKLKQSADDPSIYQFSAYAVGGEKFKHCGTAQIQWDALKAKDYKLPETLEEMEAMIKDYIAASPTTEDGLDRIGISLSTSDWHWMITLGNPAGFIADGAPDNGQWIITDDNKAMYKFRSEKEREYFRWMCRMYNEGILDPDFATQTHEDYIAKIASRDCRSLCIRKPSALPLCIRV